MGDVDDDGNDELAVGSNRGADGLVYTVVDRQSIYWVPLLAVGNWESGVTALAFGSPDSGGREMLAVGFSAGEGVRYEVRLKTDTGWATRHVGGTEWPKDRGVTAVAWGDVVGDEGQELAIGRNAGPGMRYQVIATGIGLWKTMLQGGVPWTANRAVTALAMGDGDSDGTSELAIGRNGGDGWRFQVNEYNAGLGKWESTYEKGLDSLSPGRAVQALVFPDVDSDENDELLVGLNAGSDERSWLYDWGIPRNVRASVSDAVLEADGGAGAGLLFRQLPGGDAPVGPNGSVGKFLTLLVALEAIQAPGSDLDFDDPVTISKTAAGTAGSHMGSAACDVNDCLEEGDVVPLELLLHAMMNRSDNRAAVAVAELVAGSSLAFAEKVATRANEIFGSLGVPTRFDADCLTAGYDPNGGLSCFVHPAGSSFTTLQDLVSLWHVASLHPDFDRFANAQKLPAGVDTCGEDAEGEAKCFPPALLQKGGTGNYPGQGAWKGDAGGHPPSFGLPLCTSCVVSEATRLGRTMIVALQQTGDRWGDVRRLLNWAYAKQFAPDLRALTATQTLVRDFGIDAPREGVAVTAAVDAGNQLRVCSWTANVHTGTVGGGSCVTATVGGLPAGEPPPLRPTTLDITQVSALRADGDYVVGHLVPGGPNGLMALSLTGWRVGSRQV